MPPTPQYPVAVIADDGIPIRFESYAELVRDVEPDDVSQCQLLDSTGAAFQICVQAPSNPGLLTSLLSSLGAPERYSFIPLPNPILSPELRKQIHSMLHSSPLPGNRGNS